MVAARPGWRCSRTAVGLTRRAAVGAARPRARSSTTTPASWPRACRPQRPATAPAAAGSAGASTRRGSAAPPPHRAPGRGGPRLRDRLAPARRRAARLPARLVHARRDRRDRVGARHHRRPHPAGRRAPVAADRRAGAGRPGTGGRHPGDRLPPPPCTATRPGTTPSARCSSCPPPGRSGARTATVTGRPTRRTSTTRPTPPAATCARTGETSRRGRPGSRRCSPTTTRRPTSRPSTQPRCGSATADRPDRRVWPRDCASCALIL